MNRRAFLFAVFAVAPVLASGATSSQPSADSIKRAKERAGLLLRPQRETAPPPAAGTNPFRLPGNPGPAHPVDAVAVTRATDAETLARLAGTLKINGLVSLAGVPQVIINQLSYKEGDLVAVREGEQVTYLRVVHIAPLSVTVELNNVEQVIHLK